MKVVENVHFVENPYERPGYFTSTTIIVGRSITLVDAGTPQSAEESIFPYLRDIGRDIDEVTLVILTHGHYDHCGSAAQIAKVTGAKIACHRFDVSLVEHPKRLNELLHQRFPDQFPPSASELFEAAKVDIVLDDRSQIDLGGRLLEVVHTPGHSAGSICLLDREHRLAISGDSIQGKGERRPILFHGYKDYTGSIKRMRGEDIITLLTGHPFPPINHGIVQGAQVELLLQESATGAQELRQRIEELLRSSGQELTIAQMLEMLPGVRPSTVGCMLEDMVAARKVSLDRKTHHWRQTGM